MLFIFDMGGVVTTTFAMESIYEKLNISKDVFFELCRYSKSDIWHELEIGNISSKQFWTEFSKRIGLVQRNELEGGFTSELLKNIDFSKIPEIKTDLFRLFFHPSKNLKTIELIQKLKEKHRVVCGTNTIQSHWENHLERGDYAFFNQTYASNKIGAAKPDTEFFKLILEAEAYSPKETFFTDDKIANCQAAQSLGINTFHFTCAEDLWKEWEKYL
ncbi:MAG: HAD family phosphatase [Treponema sp.]|nr:HAD family phosphatase [Treponema sp.]